MNQTRKLLISTFLFMCLFICGQNSKINGLQNELPNSKPDTNKVKTLIELAKQYRFFDPEKTLNYAQQAFDLYFQTGDEWGICYGYKFIGMCYFDKKDNSNAAAYWNKSLSHFQKINDYYGNANTTNNLATIYTVTGRRLKALEVYNIALNASEKTGDRFHMATTLHNIGFICLKDKNTYTDALTYLKKALGYAEKISEINLISLCNINIGEAYMEMGNDDELQII